MTKVQCPICGRVYTIPDGHGRAMVESRFLHHKDSCQLPREDDFVLLGNRVGVVINVHDKSRTFPTFTIQLPSGRMREYGSAEIQYPEDQAKAREQFYE